MNEIKTGDIWKHKFFNFEVKVDKVIDDVIHVFKNKKKMEIYKPEFLEYYEFVKSKTKGKFFLKVGDIAYILGRYTPDGDTKIVEIEIIKAWDNGKILAYTTNGPGEWKFYQSYFGKVVFRTREEAEKALRQEEK